MNSRSHIPTEMLLPLCLPNHSHLLSPLITSFDFSPPPPPPRRCARPRFTTALSVLKTSRPEARSGISEITQSKEESGEDNEGGFLKLKSTKERLSGDAMAPVNKKRTLKEIQDDRERRKRLNFLRYEALKRELLFLTVGIGTAGSGYCLVVLSVQAALSYAMGVAFSCLYYQLLCQHADNLSQETIPEIFKKKKLKKIGIRSQDLQDFFERSVKGSSIALSSPRLGFLLQYMDCGNCLSILLMIYLISSWFLPWLGCLYIKQLAWCKCIGTMKTFNFFFPRRGS